MIVKNVFLVSSFTLCLLLYSLLRIARYANLSLPKWVLYQGTDVLFVPFSVLLATIVIRFFRKPTFIPGWGMHFFVLLLAIVTFELYLPSQNAAFTSDWLDVIAYGIGSLASFSLLKFINKVSLSN